MAGIDGNVVESGAVEVVGGSSSSSISGGGGGGSAAPLLQQAHEETPAVAASAPSARRPRSASVACRRDRSEEEPTPKDSALAQGDVAEVQAKASLPLLGVPEQRAISLVLLAATVVLMLGPAVYCWLDQGRAELADSYRGSAHSADGTCHSCTHEAAAGHGKHHHPVMHASGAVAHEVVSGGIHGLLMMLATVLGGIGADIPGRGIFAMGTASLAAYSFSVGFGTFVVESAKDEFAMSQLQEEYQEVRTSPEEEISEMICHYRQRGLTEEDARKAAEIFSKYEDFWVQHMMAEELGIQLPRGRVAAAKSGLATGLSFLLFGALPILGVAVSLALHRSRGPRWYRPQFSTLVALLFSAAVLLALGVLLSRVSGSRSLLANSMLVLANGCAACLFASSVGQLCVRLCGSDGPEAADDASADAGSAALAAPSASGAPAAVASGAARTASGGPCAGDCGWSCFRRQFLYSLAALFAGTGAVIICSQFVERGAYDSFRVFLYGLLTCVTTGLGVVPFLLAGPDAVGESPLAVANAVASGMMTAASVGMIWEAHDHCGPGDWQIIVGLLVGGLFIQASERLHTCCEDEGEKEIEVLHNALMERRHLRKAMLIFTVMFCHSAAEGVAVGVAFSRRLSAQFGMYVSVLLAVHNVPEGLAVALVLVPRGVSVRRAAVLATLTSVPQPLLAVAAFLFVDAFEWLLPLGLAFAAGAMLYVCLTELLREAAERLGWLGASAVSLTSFLGMTVVMAMLHRLTGA